MPTDKRRADARRRAWGRGPVILRFEPLEGRALLAASASPRPDLVGTAFDTVHNLDWGDPFHAKGVVTNEGTAPVTTPFHVDIYASPTAAVGPGSVLIGQATIPAGLQPGQNAPFDQVVNLPQTPLTGVAPSGSIYVSTVIDPEGLVAESNTQNNSGNGQGYDTSVVTITPHLPSDLVGASLGVYPDQAQWGQTVQVSAQITNNAQGDAPPTRARFVLTPVGFQPGGPGDVTIGSVNVPAVPAWQTVAVNGTFTLPAFTPSSLQGYSQFTLSMIQDSDFVTNPMSPHLPSKGLGFDQTQIAITATGGTPAAQNIPRPDLTPTQVVAPSLPLTFGQSFQVTTTLANQGNLDAPAFRVRYLLVGTDGSLKNALFLGDTTVDGLKAGAKTNLVQTLTLPSRLPGGVTLNSQGVGQIAVVVDPENTLDEANEANNSAVSGVVSLRVVGTNGQTTTPVDPTTTATTPAPTPTAAQQAQAAALQQAQAAKLAQANLLKQARAAKQAQAANRTTARQVPAPRHTLSHNLKVFPKKVSNYVHKLLG